MILPNSFVGGFSHVGSAVQILSPMAVLAIAQRAIDDVGTILVGPFGALCPPHLFLKRLWFNFGTRQQELSTGSETHLLAFVIDTSDAAQHHSAMRVPAVYVLLFIREVVGLDNLVVIAKMLESGVGVHLRETAVHDADTQALAIDAFVDEMLSAETLHLVGKDILIVFLNLLELGLNVGNRSVGNDFLNTSHKW